jgi:hypothetical protein
VVFYQQFALKCPGCNKEIGGGISKVYGIRIKTGLGPEQVRCGKCGQVIETGLLEWQHMSTGQKVCYGILSVINSAVGSFMPGLSIFFFADRFVGLPSQGDVTNRVMLTSFLVFFMILLSLQVLRVEFSNRRVDETTQEIMKASFWSWQLNFQMVVLLAGLALFVLGALAFFIR